MLVSRKNTEIRKGEYKMTTHTDISKSGQTIQSPLGFQIFAWILGLFIILSLVLLGVGDILLTPETEAPLSESRAMQAWTARYQGLANEYTSSQVFVEQKALNAWAARYQALASEYALKVESMSQEAMDAWTTRYQGLASEYALMVEGMSQKALDAWAARYQGLADEILSKE
jgi:hemoglobin-like flavoprotein